MIKRFFAGLLVAVMLINGGTSTVLAEIVDAVESVVETEAIETAETATENAESVETTETAEMLETTETVETTESVEITEGVEVPETEIQETENAVVADSEQDVNAEESTDLGRVEETAETEDTEEATVEAESEDISSDVVVEDVEDVLYLATETVAVSRLEWLTALTTTFEMSVEVNNYPDNYFSDIDSSSANYHQVMLATEFGLVDVEAGQPLRPNDAATREFVAHSLNVCMGYMLEEEEYTFSEAETVKYAKDIQIAINKGWMELVGKDFLPEQAITVAEKDKMIAAAQAVVDSVKIDNEYENQYQFKEGVIVIPEETNVVLTDENVLTISDCDVELNAGDIFVVFSNGFPVAKRALEIVTTGNQMVVTVEGVDVEDAFIDLEAEGTIEADLAQLQVVEEGVTLTYIVGGTKEMDYSDGIRFDSLEQVGKQEVSAVIATKTMEAPYSKLRAGLEDNLSVECLITNVRADYNVSLTEQVAYFNVDADVEFSFNVKVDDPSEVGWELRGDIVRVPIALVGFIGVSLEGNVTGSSSLVMKNNVSVGVQWTGAEGVRLTHSFKKESFSLNTKVEVTVGIKAAAGVDVAFIKGELYFMTGAKGYVESKIYLDGLQPDECLEFAAHLYMTAGASVKLRLILFSAEVKLEEEIINKDNSPVRIVLHMEGGNVVSQCGRESSGDSGNGSGSNSSYKYYTPVDSKYTSGGSNIGRTANGSTYSIFSYTTNGDEATITKYNGTSSVVNIPEMLDGYTVVEIGGSVFAGNKALKIVHIPDTVLSIGSSAFLGCSNLEMVNLPKTLTKMGHSVFGNCVNLTSIKIPPNLEAGQIEGIFKGCDNLKYVTFEEGTTKIVNHLFSECLGLEEIVIPDTVTYIDEFAFYYCENLRKVYMPDTVKYIGNGAFQGCANLEIINLSKSLTQMGSDVFMYCDSLTSIEIPKSLEVVDIGVFEQCDNLREIIFEEGTTKIIDFLFYHCNGLEEIEIPDTITHIGNFAFKNCINLKMVKLPKKLIEMGAGAFGECDSLTSIVIPKSLEEVGIERKYRGAFEYCDNLSEVIFEEGITRLPDDLFSNCVGLKTIVIPDTVTSVGNGIFSDCTSLENVTLSNNLVNISESMFYNCKKLTTINFPNALEKIQWRAFGNCESLKTVVLPVKVISIENEAFRGCVELEKVIIPDATTYMGEDVFYGCKNLVDITLGVSLTSIPSKAFYDCSSLVSLIVPEGVNEIGENAFSNCSSLRSITIPRTTTKIAYNAFSRVRELVIYGIRGSYAEEYAKEENIDFIELNIFAEEVLLDATEKIVNKGESFQLTVTISPQDFTDEVIWTSSNESVAIVSSNGYVEAVGVGITDVIVTVGSFEAKCKVVVKDGDPSEQEQQVCSFVERMYTIVLNRDADPNGLNDWVAGLIEQRVDGAAVVDGFVNSAEFVARGLNDEDYIKVLYRAILGREPGEDEVALWMTALAQGQTRQDLLNGFVTSAEFDALCDSYGILAVMTQEDMVRNFASRMYTVALNRAADEAGLTYWVGKLMSGQADGAAIADGFINSPEFIARNLNDTDYIKTLYLTFLNREADAAGLNSWLGALAQGYSRPDVLLAFIGTEEFGALCESYGISAILTQRDLVENFVKRMYTVALNREADASGLNDWVTGLINGVIYGAQVADGFIGSAEFEARGLSNEDYVKTLYQTFFNRSASDSDVSGWVSAMTVYGQSRRDVLKGFVNSAEFGTLCENYGIVRGTLQ